MPILLRWWERQQASTGAANRLPLTTSPLIAIQPTLNAAATLLRSIHYPQFTMEDELGTVPTAVAWAEFVVMMVAWYEPIFPGFIPQPDDLDSRIVATSRLYPRRVPTALAVPNTYNVTWEPPGGMVQSFGQRKPDPATFINPELHVGFWVNDPSGFFYAANPGIRFLFSCYSEALFGI